MKTYKINNHLLGINGALYSFDPYDVNNLPKNTVLVRTSGEFREHPSTVIVDSYDAYYPTDTPNEYLVYKQSNDWSNLLAAHTEITDILGANTSSVYNLSGAFRTCTNVSSVAWFDTSNVTNMNSTFRDCYRITDIPAFDTSNVTSMEHTFATNHFLTSTPQLDYSKVTSLRNCFAYCSRLKVANISAPECTSFYATFLACQQFGGYLDASTTHIPAVSCTPYMPKAIDVNCMYSGCFYMAYPYDVYNIIKNNTNITAHILTFAGAGAWSDTGSAQLAQIPSDWK